MADINPLSPYDTVETYVRSFIYEDVDGSQRVNEAAFSAWLYQQFQPLTGGEVSESTKNADAAQIAARLASAINRERFVGTRYFPARTSASNNESSTARLVSIQAQMTSLGKALEAPYSAIQAGLAGRVKSLYSNEILPSFPAGTKVLEETRTYVETFVTDRGEESAPSPASALVTLDSNDTCTVTCSAPPAGRYVTKRRLYRSATGTNANAFKLHGEYPIATTVIVDSKPVEQLADVLATTGWLEPPANLANLCGMANGILLGSVGNTLYASEPFAPYAYPVKYTKPLMHNIIGIVATQQFALVGTSKHPYVLTGADSASLSEEKVSSGPPCSSARSMVAIDMAVFYASPYGLALYENGAVSIVTENIIDRDKWTSYNPQTMRAAAFNGVYFVFYTKADDSKGCLAFDYKARSMVELEQAADAVFADEAGIYVLNGTAVYDLMPVGVANRTGKYVSKTFRLARPQAFSWLRVDSDFLNNGGAAAATVNIYRDDVLHHTVVVASSAPVRCPAGRGHDWRVEVDCAARINGVVLASTTDELKGAI